VVAHVHDAIGARIFVDEQDVLLALHDLEGIRHVGRARDPRHVALGFRVRLRPVLPVRLALLQRLRLVRNRAALDNALARWDRTDGAELPEGCGLSRVIFDVPVGAGDRLVDPVHVGMTSNSRRTRNGCLRCRTARSTLTGTLSAALRRGTCLPRSRLTRNRNGQRQYRRCRRNGHHDHRPFHPISHAPGLL
jgi:hypothetical protein